MPMQKLLRHPSVQATKCHQCRYGAVCETGSGEPRPVLKPTRFMSNSTPMLRRLSKLCNGDHEHAHLVGKRKTEKAAFYPLPLLKAILQGMAGTTHSDGVPREFTSDEYDAALTMSINDSLPEAERATEHEGVNGPEHATRAGK